MTILPFVLVVILAVVYLDLVVGPRKKAEEEAAEAKKQAAERAAKAVDDIQPVPQKDPPRFSSYPRGFRVRDINIEDLDRRIRGQNGW